MTMDYSIMLDFAAKPNNYSINLMWINSTLDAGSRYIVQNADKDAVINKILTPVIKWKKANPEADVNLWYDSHFTSAEALQNTKTLMNLLLNTSDQNILSNIQFRDIREISVVKNNPDVFSSNFPVYFLIDLLKLIVCLHCVENLSNESAVFSDLEVGDKRENKDRMSKEELFNEDVMERLNNIGVLNGPAHENQFFQVLNKPETIVALKHIINANLYRAVTALNYKSASDRKYAMESLSVLVFNSTRYDLFHYLLYKIKVNPQLVGEEGVDEIDYNPLKHGYMPFANFYNRIRNIPYIKIKNDFVEREELTTFPNTLKVGEPAYCGRSDLKVRMGNDHQFWFDDSKTIPAADGGTEYKCAFWNVSENDQNYFNELQNNSDKAALIPEFLIKKWEVQKPYNTINMAEKTIDVHNNFNNSVFLPALEAKKQQDKNVSNTKKRKFETLGNNLNCNEPRNKKKKIEKKAEHLNCSIA